MATYTLKHPIKDADGKEIKELEFGRLKAKHLAQIPERFLELAMNSSELEEGGAENAAREMRKNIPEMLKHLPAFISALTGHPIEVIGEMEVSDIMGAFDGIGGDFFGESDLPPAGERPVK